MKFLAFCGYVCFAIALWFAGISMITSGIVQLNIAATSMAFSFVGLGLIVSSMRPAKTFVGLKGEALADARHPPQRMSA